jgi:hypothetical protein
MRSNGGRCTRPCRSRRVPIHGTLSLAQFGVTALPCFALTSAWIDHRHGIVGSMVPTAMLLDALGLPFVIVSAVNAGG